MAKVTTIGKLPSGIHVLAERELLCQTGGSNKFYTCVLGQDPATGNFIAGARYGRINGSSYQTAMWYDGPSRAGAESLIATMLDEKVNRGRSRYVTADGRSITPSFPGGGGKARSASNVRPSGGASTAQPAPSAPVAPARQIRGFQDALSRRRGG